MIWRENLSERTGCLLIHGFGGNVSEVAYLRSYMNSKGYLVICSHLKGHTGRRKDMVGVSHVDWVESAEQDLIRLMETHDKVFIVGFSMGGLVGATLCEKYGIDGLVTINSPVYCWDLKNIFRNMLLGVTNGNFRDIKRYFLSFMRYPPSSVFQFLKFISVTKTRLKKVLCPALVLQSKNDDTVRRKSAEYIFTELGSDDKNLKYYETGGHVILKSEVAADVSCDIEKFIRRVLEKDAEKLHQGHQ